MFRWNDIDYTVTCNNKPWPIQSHSSIYMEILDKHLNEAELEMKLRQIRNPISKEYRNVISSRD